MMQGNNGAANLLAVVVAVPAITAMFKPILPLTPVAVLLLAIAVLISKNDEQ